MEKVLVAASIKSREFYEQVNDLIDSDKDLGPIAAHLMDKIGGHYARDPSILSVDLSTFSGAVADSGSNKTNAAIVDYLGSLDIIGTSIPNALHLCREILRDSIGRQLVVAISGGKSKQEIYGLIAKLQDIDTMGASEEDNKEVLVGQSVQELVKQSFDGAKLIKLAPKALNDRVDGGARPGHHIVIYARPEMGKTLFAINLTAGFLMQGLPVLYCGNEDPQADIAMRAVCRLARMPKQAVLADPAKADAEARKNGYDKLYIAHMAPGTFSEINKLVDKLKPAVVVLDQLRNIQVDPSNRVESLEKAATEARNLAKSRSVLVVSLTQAGNSAENKNQLDMGDIDSSKTGIPAQADLMIGIGADNSLKDHGIRVLSFPKNKLSGKHGHFEITIDPTTGIVKGPQQ